MNKKRYIKPGIETLGLTTEKAFCDYSYDNTGNNGSDGEKGKVIEGELPDGVEVGAKGHGSWSYDDEEW